MIESMTGFGRGDAHINGYSVEAEIRTVNNRYCDVFIKLPSEFQHFESELRTLIQSRFERGKINVTVKIENTGAHGTGLNVNKDLARSYYELLSDLGNELGIQHPPTLEQLLEFDDIFVQESISDEQEQAFKDTLKKAVESAAENTIQMRKNEGAELSKDLLERIDKVEAINNDIQEKCNGRVDEARTKLQERVTSLIGDEKIDKDRLELEIALLADKLDITEELVRLQSHLKFFREAVNGKQSPGRKLNFLLQEMLREINTIGSKSYNADISHRVVESKEIIEIIREQVQNIV